jgi:hypothetical protein
MGAGPLRTDHVLRHRRLGNLDAQLLEFPVNPGRAPEGVGRPLPHGLLGVDGPIKSQLDAQVGHGIGHICGLGLLGYKPPSSVTWSPRRV